MEKFGKTTIARTTEIRAGDCVFIHGHWRTLSPSDVQYSSLSGTTICGDPLVLEGRTIKIALFPKWYKGQIIGWYSQL